jgi:hypothetical protein
VPSLSAERVGVRDIPRFFAVFPAWGEVVASRAEATLNFAFRAFFC